MHPELHEYRESRKSRNNVLKMLAHLEMCKHTHARKMAQMSTAGRSGNKEADEDAGGQVIMDSAKRVKSGPNTAAASSKKICTVSVLLVLFTVP